MLRFIDGFDYCDVAGARLKYDYRAPEGEQADMIDGTQPPNRQGGGRALFLFSTIFEYSRRTRIMDGQSKWIVGRNFRNRGDGAPAGSFFYRWESRPSETDGSNSGTQLAVRTNADSKLEFYAGGAGTNGDRGTLIATPDYVFVKDVDHYLEIVVTFGGSGTLDVYVDDVSIYHATGLNITNSTHPGNPDRHSIWWQSFGTAGQVIDNLYICDGQGDTFNDRLGPCRVTIVSPIANVVHEWLPTGAAANFQCVQDQILPDNSRLPVGAATMPDDDTTYVQASATALDMYENAKMPCYGLDLAVAWNVCARNPFSGAPTLDLVCRPKANDIGTQLDVSGGNPLTASYRMIQGIVTNNPGTSTNWRDKEIDNALWGFRRNGAGTVRVTQAFVEKLTSLRSVPYNCGQGSYSF